MSVSVLRNCIAANIFVPVFDDSKLFHLHHLAQHIFNAPASSVTSESLFSQAGPVAKRSTKSNIKDVPS